MEMEVDVTLALEMIQEDRNVLENQILTGVFDIDDESRIYRLRKNHKFLVDFIKEYLSDDDRLIPLSLRTGVLGMRYCNSEGESVLVTYKPFHFIHNFDYDRCFDYKNFIGQLELKRSLWTAIADKIEQLSNVKKVVIDIDRIGRVIVNKDENGQG